MNNIFLNPSYFNPDTLLAIGLAPHIEAAIEYLKANWYLPPQFAPYAATILSLGVQIGGCFYFGIPLTAALIGTIATTAATVWYHELTTP